MNPQTESIQVHFQGNYNQFYSKYLPNVKKIGGHEYQALCPFHEDTKPSLNFSDETGAYFCHGCGKKGNAFHFYARTHNLDDRKDFPKILDGIACDFGIALEKEERRMVKAYDYTDAEGKLLFQVCRFEPKHFTQRRPDGNGGWIWDLKGVETVLYRLPNILKANEVLIVEGEKDVDNLALLGFVATTCPMGAKKWKDHYNEFLKGKDLILCPDNDNEGREHMTQVAISVNGNSRSLRWLELPGLPSKGDISDWIVGFSDPEDAAERLTIMLENAEPYTPPKRKTLEDIVITSQDFHSLDIPKRSEHLHPWFKEASIILITGERGIGKSFFAHQIANSIRKGESCGPWGCNFCVPILLVDGEMSCNDLQERCELLGLNTDGLSPLYLYSDAMANQHGIQRAHLMNEAWREKVKSIILARHIKILILDNISSLASGIDENVKKDWDPINQWLIELRFLGIATIMLHHTSKAGLQRGTSAREDNLDISIMLKRPTDYTPEDGCRFIVSFAKARVSQDALSLIGDTEFKLIQNESGNYIFEYKNVRRAVKKDVTRMLSEGMKPTAIVETLGVSKGYVSRIKKEGIQSGYFCKDGKLSAAGDDYVKDDAQ